MHIKKAIKARRFIVAAAATLATVGVPATASAASVSVDGVSHPTLCRHHVWARLSHSALCGCHANHAAVHVRGFLQRRPRDMELAVGARFHRVSPGRGGVRARIKVEGDGGCDGKVDVTAIRETGELPYGASEKLSLTMPTMWASWPSFGMLYQESTVKIMIKHGPDVI